MKFEKFSIVACGLTVQMPSFELSDAEITKVIQFAAGRKVQEQIDREELPMIPVVDEKGNPVLENGKPKMKKVFKYSLPKATEIIDSLKGITSRGVSDEELITFFVGRGKTVDQVKKALADTEKRKKAVAVYKASNTDPIG